MSASFVPLGSVAHFINGAAFKPEDWHESGVRIIRIQNLTDPTKPYNRTRRAVAENLRVRPGELLVSWSATLGVFEWEGPDDGLLNQHIFRVVPNEWRVDKRYLRHGLELAILDMQRHLHGATMQHVNRGEFLGTKFYLPALPEQRRIAEVLDRAEALRAKRRAVLTELDTFTQALYLDLFGDPATNPKGWRRVSLGEIARNRPNNGIFRKNPTYLQKGNEGLPVVWVEQLFRGDSIDIREARRLIPTASEVDKYGLKAGDILFCRSSLKFSGIAFNNVYLGEDNAALFECHVIRISPNLKIISPIFLNCLLRLPQLRAMAKSKSKTATMTTIDQESLCSIEVPVPPIELQSEFVRSVSCVAKLKATHRTSLTELDALFASLQHRAFRGEL